jgi:filamentous hemagglutinin
MLRSAGRRIAAGVAARRAGGSLAAGTLARAVAPKNPLSTSANQAVFWSGLGQGRADKAAAWASRNCGVTIESALLNRGLNMPAFNPKDPASLVAWKNASIDFAKGARGDVHVLQGNSLRIDAIWKDEFYALASNPNVKSIASVNIETNERILLWHR